MRCRCGRSISIPSSTLPESPLLLLEFHGSDAGVQEQAERFGEIAAEFGGGPFEWATKPEDRTRLWQARHDAYWAARGLRPGRESVATDVCVPISRLAECVDETKRDIEASGLIAPIVGHVGDGNFHVSAAREHGRSGGSRGLRRPSSTAWSSGRSPWRAPAPASTASARRR